VRGVRVLFGLYPASDVAAGLVSWLEARGMVFDAVAHPNEVAAYLRLLEATPDLVVALEHAGWPNSGDDEHFAEWRVGMDALAARPNTYCKISGLAMTLHTLDAAAQGRWIEGCIEAFSPDRCMFGSNFPVDRMFGSFADLYGTYDQVTADLPEDERAKLFSSTARRVYGLGVA
jgi:predicted TIM-barrel fold metal-dependent hydrolase